MVGEICGGCGLACENSDECATSLRWRQQTISSDRDFMISPQVARQLLSQATCAAIVIGSGVPAGEVLTWVEVANRYHTLWVWDQDTRVEQAWALEGGKHAHFDWVVQCADKLLVWAVDVDRYPPWDLRFNTNQKQILKPPAVRGDLSWRWIMAQWAPSNVSYWERTAILLDPYAVDETTLFLLHRWSNRDSGPYLALVTTHPHRLGARRLAVELVGTVLPGWSAVDEGRIQYGLTTSHLSAWGCDVVIWVQGDETAALPSNLGATVIVVGPAPLPDHPWIPLHWARDRGGWSLADDGVVVQWRSKEELETVAHDWFLA